MHHRLVLQNPVEAVEAVESVEVIEVPTASISELTEAKVATPELTTLEVATPELTTLEVATFNLPSFAVAANIETATNGQSNRANQSDEAVQLAPLALVGVGLDTAATEQEFLDRVFEITGRDNDVAVKVQLTDIDSLFESSFSVDL